MIQIDFSQPLPVILNLLNSYSEQWIIDITHFINQWNDKQKTIQVQTSGTTGQPKILEFEKSWMVYSAQNTLKYFGLKKGDTALLALSPKFIAGKMMLVRGIIGHLKVWICPPNDLSILRKTIDIDFCPLVPIQAEKYFSQLYKIKHLLLGGAPVSSALEIKLQNLPINVYQSFAMTETLSHFALRNITKKELSYTIFKSIIFGVNVDSCLWIKAPGLGQEFIQTTDVVELVEHGFIWKQRADFMINSGGIKYNPEVLENQCHFLYQKGWSFIISSIPDEILGNKLVLVVEKHSIQEPFNGLCKDQFDLDTYAIPKVLYIVKEIPRTPFSQKVTRLSYQNIFHENNILEIHEIL